MWVVVDVDIVVVAIRSPTSVTSFSGTLVSLAA